MVKYILIVCVDNRYGIGKNGKIPWTNKEDLTFFYKTTIFNPVIMGRKTYESIGHPLSNRINLVMSKSNGLSYNEVIEKTKNYNNVYIIGGCKIYKLFMHIADEFIINTIDGDYECDTLFPIEDFNKLLKNSDYSMNSINISHNIISKTYVIHKRYTDEYKYLKLMKQIIKNGNEYKGRNGIVYSLVGKKLSYNLLNEFPILTTKKMFFRGIVEELLFFIRGDTDTTILSKKGVNIWKKNTNDGDMGPMYGYQWRYFGKNKEYNGYDQLQYVIDTIRNDPTSRRIIMTSYNPIDAPKGCLYPCHGIHIQFIIEQKKYITCIVTLRSNDMFLGHPFNLSSYALLTYIIGKYTNYTPYKLHMFIGDAHIYKEHIDAVKTQLERNMFHMPLLEINIDDKKIDELQYENFKLVNYKYHTTIKAEMIQ